MFFSSKPSTTHERALSLTFSLQRDVNGWWIINDFPPLSLSLHKSSGLVSVSKFCLRALMMRMSIWRTISLLKCQDFSSSKKWESLTNRPCSTFQLLGQPNELLYMNPGQWDTRLPLSNVIWRIFFHSTVMLMPDDFRAYSKIKIDNHAFNKENLPSHFKVTKR